MGQIRHFDSVLDISYGKDATLDALLLHFMTENHLEYSLDPDKTATAEQIRFMVALREGEFYAPCSDWMFHMLLKPGLPKDLLQVYLDSWKDFIRLTRNFCPDRYLSSRFIGLAKHKFRMILASPIVIPSRFMKRLITIFMTQSGIDDPYRTIRRALNRRAAEMVRSKTFDIMVNACRTKGVACQRIDKLRFDIDMLEIERLMRLSTYPDNWASDSFDEQALANCGLEAEMDESPGLFKPVCDALESNGDKLRILYLPNRSGGLLLDLQVVRSLLRLGHRVVLAFKEGFYFDSPTFWDHENDPELAEAIAGAHFVDDDRLSKNELLDIMNHHPFVVISDGTRERFNPYRTSVTFARTWKECDLILAKGEAKYRRLIQTSHEFTRDIVCFFRDEANHFHLHHRPKASWIHKFSEGYIIHKAEEIITEMRRARAEGKTVVFYSGIIGSVPGQVDTAIEIMTTHVAYLRERMEDAFIINPGEHFEEGMDADDLMFMWERVQRSGYIDVWRFQTHFDIEKSFQLMGKRVPPIWAGKDATYSTGCTKEMHIALDVQRRQPELQIIGPSPDKFFRRREYGVGRFCDVAVDSCK